MCKYILWECEKNKATNKRTIESDERSTLWWALQSIGVVLTSFMPVCMSVMHFLPIQSSSRCIRRWLSTVESLLLAVSHDAQLNKNLLGLITHGSFIHTLNYELGTWTRLVIVSIKWTNFMSSLNHITCYEKEIEQSVIKIVLH